MKASDLKEAMLVRIQCATRAIAKIVKLATDPESIMITFDSCNDSVTIKAASILPIFNNLPVIC